mmetsp:Transcript_39300/g.109179  ORF Transcript_39300/g.109179 Transcript_39300/m.109179 type:complete len:343 (-) Transcript_39300:66-1094(-)
MAPRALVVLAVVAVVSSQCLARRRALAPGGGPEFGRATNAQVSIIVRQLGLLEETLGRERSASSARIAELEAKLSEMSAKLDDDGAQQNRAVEVEATPPGKGVDASGSEERGEWTFESALEVELAKRSAQVQVEELQQRLSEMEAKLAQAEAESARQNASIDALHAKLSKTTAKNTRMEAEMMRATDLEKSRTIAGFHAKLSETIAAHARLEAELSEKNERMDKMEAEHMAVVGRLEAEVENCKVEAEKERALVADAKVDYGGDTSPQMPETQQRFAIAVARLALRRFGAGRQEDMDTYIRAEYGAYWLAHVGRAAVDPPVWSSNDFCFWIGSVPFRFYSPV